MTDRVQKIREEVVGMINSINLFTPDEDGKNSSYEAGKLDVASKILQVIDSLPEEPVSEDLQEFIIAKYNEIIGSHGEYDKTYIDGMAKAAAIECGMAGAQWQLEHQWISVKDRLPIEEFDDGYTFVFVKVDVDEDTYKLETDYIRNGKWELHPNENITHWMPIPPIPNMED